MIRIVGLLAMAAAACGAPETDRCARAADHSVVACVDGAAVLAGEVAEHLRAPAPVPGRAALPDPRRHALEAALQVRLFAGDAARRGLGARDRVRRSRALIADELARLGIAPDAVSEREAEAYYRAQPGLFNKIPAVRCRALYVDDPARAEALYAALEGGTDEAFAAAGGVDVGRLAIGADADPALLRLAGQLRSDGALAGPVALADGRYVVLRATAIELHPAPLEGTMLHKVKNWIANQRERAALGALYQRLRAGAAIEVFEDELARLPVPAP